MKHIFKITKHRLLFIILALCTTNAFGMNWIRSWCGCKRAKTEEIGESKAQEILSTELAIHDHKKLYTLLYNLITTMPPELIRIILDYDSDELKGVDQQIIHGNPELFLPLIELPHGKIAFKAHSGTINIADIKTGDITRKITTNGVPLTASRDELISFDPGRNNIRCYDINTGDCRSTHTFNDMQSPNFAIELSPKLFAIGSQQEQLALFNTETDVYRFLREKQNCRINCMAKLSDTILGEAISTFWGNWVQLWDISKEKCIVSIRCSNKPFCFLRLSEHFFALGTQNSRGEDFIEIWRWDHSKAFCIKTIDIRTRMPRFSLVKLTNGLLAVNNLGGIIKLINPINNEEKILKHGDNIIALLALANGGLASQAFNRKSDTSEIKIWE